MALARPTVVLPKIPDVFLPASGRPSVLAVTSQVPWPLDSGGHLRTYHLLRSLAAGMDVRLVAPAAPEAIEPCCAALENAGVAPAVVSVPRRTFAGESVKVLRAAFDQEPYVLYARHRQSTVLETLQMEVASRPPAALYLDHLDSLVYADAFPGIPLVIDMHNVYSRLVARVAGESGAIRRRYLERESALLERMERRAVSVAHTVLAVSVEEAQYFRQLGARRAVVVPNGVDCDRLERLPIENRAGAPTVLFVGSLSWPSNVHAVRFLATEVLPSVRKSMPSARLVVVGRDPGPEVMSLARPGSNVEVAGNVEDVAPYYRAAHVLAVPLQSGGGTRLKILEAFAAGVPVVSTPVGCEGIEAISGSHLAVAEIQDFSAAVAKLLEQPHKARVLAVRARTLAREKYDWSVVGRSAIEAVAAASSSAVTPIMRLDVHSTRARRVPVS
jgi:polysaccharide biosynthesis protein PslH